MSEPNSRASCRRIQALAGMTDLHPQAYERSEVALARLRTHLGAQGYRPIDTPLLEDTELFVRKAGGELAGRLYNFTDPGGNAVSLRPEFTSSVIRYFIDNHDAMTLPVRWQYAGPVFRYEPAKPGAYRQFTQAGAELVGAAGVDADAEIISLAASGLRQLGIQGAQLRIGHLGVMHSLLDNFGLSDPAKLFVISNMHALKRGTSNVETLMTHARDVGLLRPGIDLDGFETTLENMSAEAAEDFILEVLKESMPTPVGRRSVDDIIARLLRKVRCADSPESFERALRFAERLSKLAGEPQATLRLARNAAAESGIDAAPLGELDALLALLSDNDIPESQTTLDMRMARGFSYYTGVIFDLVSSDGTHDSEEALGGGGRYDGLVQALGGDECVPAMGFAYNVNVLLDVLDSGAVTDAPTAGAAR